MLIRERTGGDLPRLAEILRTTHLRDSYPLRAENASVAWLTRHSGPAWVLVVDDEVVGHVALDLRSSDRGSEIVRYFVAPVARGIGGAPLLLQQALEHAHAVERDAWLVVMPHNTAAVAMYEGAGFMPDGEDGWTDPDGFWHTTLRYRYAAPVGVRRRGSVGG